MDVVGRRCLRCARGRRNKRDEYSSFVVRPARAGGFDRLQRVQRFRADSAPVAHEAPAFGFRRGRTARAQFRRRLKGRLGFLRRRRSALALFAQNARRANRTNAFFERRERVFRLSRRRGIERARRVGRAGESATSVRRPRSLRACRHHGCFTQRPGFVRAVSVRDAADFNAARDDFVQLPPRDGDEERRRVDQPLRRLRRLPRAAGRPGKRDEAVRFRADAREAAPEAGSRAARAVLAHRRQANGGGARLGAGAGAKRSRARRHRRRRRRLGSEPGRLGSDGAVFPGFVLRARVFRFRRRRHDARVRAGGVRGRGRARAVGDVRGAVLRDDRRDGFGAEPVPRGLRVRGDVREPAPGRPARRRGV
mmetsp:Transcript_15181/g.65005  ORF Transcript_15181/g.65005 Transcript_15181/m.65005 type:complete len:366 (-) Transcript_15181:3655-4752(-)